MDRPMMNKGRPYEYFKMIDGKRFVYWSSHKRKKVAKAHATLQRNMDYQVRIIKSKAKGNKWSYRLYHRNRVKRTKRR